MRNLLLFLSRHNNLIIFLLLEAISVYLLTTYDGYHSSRIFGGVRTATSFIEGRVSSVTHYMALRTENASLVSENLMMRNQVEDMKAMNQQTGVADTIITPVADYFYITAGVVNNSVNKQRNFVTIDKGAGAGLEPEMAIVGPDGVVGIIVSVSENFSVVMSVLNQEFRLSARLSRSGYFGSLVWDGLNNRRAVLNEIPRHVEVAVGDTVETSGYSAIFPLGVLIGIVSDIDDSRGDFYSIEVDLSTDFQKLRNVYAVKYRLRDEQLEIEKEVGNEQ